MVVEIIEQMFILKTWTGAPLLKGINFHPSMDK